MSVDDLAKAIITPERELAIPYEKRSQRIARGSTSVQRCYFAAADRKVDALHRPSEDINIRASIETRSPAQLRQRIEELRAESTAGQRQIAALLVEKQRVPTGARTTMRSPC